MAPQVRKALEARIAAGGFATVEAFTKWMYRHGYRIECADARTGVTAPPSEAATASVSGQSADDAPALERKLNVVRRATEQARAILAAAPDDEAALSDALIRLVQQIDFDILVQLEADGAKVNPRALAEITRSVATLARASIQQKRWIAETRAELEAKVAAAGAQVTDVIRRGGLSDDAARHIRNALLDIKV